MSSLKKRKYFPDGRVENNLNGGDIKSREKLRAIVRKEGDPRGKR